MERYLRLLIFLVLGTYGIVKAQGPENKRVELRASDSIYNLGPHLMVFEDAGREMTLSDIRELKEGFRLVNKEIVNVGYSDDAFWFKIKVSNQNADRPYWVLDLDYPFIESCDLFVCYPNGQVIQTHEGRDQDFSKKKIKVPHFVLGMDLPYDEDVEIFLRITSQHGTVIPFRIIAPELMGQELSRRNLFHGIYYGVLLIVSLASLLIAARTKDISFFFYGAYVLFFLLNISIQHGHFFQYIWPYTGWFHDNSRLLFHVFAVYSATEFAKHFFNIRKRLSWHFKILTIIEAIATLIFIYELIFDDMRHSFSWMLMSILVLIAMTLPFNYYYWKRHKLYYGKFFSWGWVALFIGLAIRASAAAGIIDANEFTLNANLYGSVLEVIFLALALADRVKTIELKKTQLQIQLIHSLKENQQMKDELNKKLEEKVEQRTQEVLKGKEDIAKKELMIQEQKLVQYSLESLQAQMNPHFIFNALNSIRDFIFRNEILISGQYITKFAQLMRKILDNSKEPFILLSKELEMMELYMAIEKLRFETEFEFVLEVDESLEVSGLVIPTMMLQPYLENSIWHGLRGIDYVGKITLRITQDGERIRMDVEDNGIGREKSMEMKKNAVKRTSRGMGITQQRMELLGESLQTAIELRIIDLKGEEGEASGTRVSIWCPIIHGELKEK